MFYSVCLNEQFSSMTVLVHINCMPIICIFTLLLHTYTIQHNTEAFLLVNYDGQCIHTIYTDYTYMDFHICLWLRIMIYHATVMTIQHTV